MALIDTSTLLGISDRAAQQYKYIADAFDSLVVEGSGFYADRATSTDDVDVEIPTLSTYNEVDTNLNVSTAVKLGTSLGNIIGGMEAHFNRRDGSNNPLQAGGWDGYASTQGVRYSEYFADLFFAIKRSRMLANSVFSEGDDEFASLEIIGGPAFTFTDGLNYGNGNALNQADGSNFAPTQLKIVVGSMGGTGADIRLSVKDENDNPTTIDVTVPGGSPASTEIDVGTSSDRFLDVFGATFVPAGDTGTLGDTFTVRNKKERTIAL